MKLKHLAIAVLVTAMAVFSTTHSATAAVENKGIIDVTTTGSNAFGGFFLHPGAGPFPLSDTINFGVNDKANITAIFTVNNSAGFAIDVTTGSAGIFNVELLANTLPIGPGVVAIQDSLNAKTFTLSFANLQPSVNYSLVVGGNVVGADGGTYSYVANLSQVPLPAAVWLFLSALAGLVATVRVRRLKAPAA